MNILVDMNLSPAWISVLEELGLEAIHWSDIGKPENPMPRMRKYSHMLVKTILLCLLTIWTSEIYLQLREQKAPA